MSGQEEVLSGQEALPSNEKGETDLETARNPATGVQQRIQFTATVKPDRTKLGTGGDDVSLATTPVSRRQSIATIPQVVSKKNKDRRNREKEEEKKKVNIQEHLMTHDEVAEQYKTQINMAKPEDSPGLTSQQAQELLLEHGPNVLTPPKKRRPLLEFWDCLSSLFNLLLIFAGILEYILLVINFKNNFQNVSLIANANLFSPSYTSAYLNVRRTSAPYLLLLPLSTPLSNFISSRNPRHFWSRSST
jgi:sodium/potassium-transporting ATPase subunit alpha